jgi:hypothetical protein
MADDEPKEEEESKYEARPNDGLENRAATYDKDETGLPSEFIPYDPRSGSSGNVTTQEGRAGQGGHFRCHPGFEGGCENGGECEQGVCHCTVTVCVCVCMCVLRVVL